MRQYKKEKENYSFKEYLIHIEDIIPYDYSYNE